jgi:hypothetical protein
MAIANYLPQKYGQENAVIARRALEVWQGVVRDYLLLEYRQDDRVQHEKWRDILTDNRRRLNVPALLDLSRHINQAFKFLENNVNPRLVLEYIAVKY